MFRPIYLNELPEGSASHLVSATEFQEIAARGQARLDKMAVKRHDISALDDYLDDISIHAYVAAAEPFGGATFNPRTGQPVNFSTADKYAVAVTDDRSIILDEFAGRDEIYDAISSAASLWYRLLSRGSHYLGVFNNRDGDIHIDVSVVVGDSTGKNREAVGRAKAEEIGAAVHAVGGAYHFATGTGIWPPHIMGRGQE
jgi:hypothetical protein